MHLSCLLAGGIFFPLAKALCLACGSDPEKGTQKKMGAYLMKTCFQTTTVSSAMFITAMAANPLAVNLAQSAGVCVWGGVGGAPVLLSIINAVRCGNPRPPPSPRGRND